MKIRSFCEMPSFFYLVCFRMPAWAVVSHSNAAAGNSYGLAGAYQVQYRRHSSQGQHHKDGLAILCLAILFQVFTNLEM